MTNTVTLPLTPANMVEFFQDKSIVYTVDFTATLPALNEKSMLIYLANLGINCDFTRVNKELVLEYITIKNFTNISILKFIHANILYYAKYKEVLFPFALDKFDEESMLTFIQLNADIVAEQLVFLDSMMLYMLTRSLGEDEEQTLTANIDDTLRDEIGFSVIQLLNFNDFLMCYLADTPDLNEQVYYSRYFDDYMFQGKNLFHHASSGAFFGLVAKITSAITNEEDKQALETLNDCLVATINETTE